MTAVRFIYWNTGDKAEKQEQVLGDVFQQTGPVDVLLLGECTAGLLPSFIMQHGLAELPILSKQKKGLQQRLYYRASTVSVQLADKIEVETRIVDSVTKNTTQGGIHEQLIRRLFLQIVCLIFVNLTVDGTPYLLAGIHFPSKKYQDEISQLQIVDQVIVSEKLADSFIDQSLSLVEVPELVAEMTAANVARAAATYADHLPITFSLNL